MTKQDKKMLAEGLLKLSRDITAIAEALRSEARDETQAPACTLEDAREVLAEKARAGFHAEVKAILTKHGLKQLSDAKDSRLYAALKEEAEAIGHG